MKSNFKIAFFAAFDAALTITFDYPEPLNFGSTRKKRYLKMQEFLLCKASQQEFAAVVCYY